MLRVAGVSVNAYFGSYFIVTISLLIPMLLVGGIAIIKLSMFVRGAAIV